MNVKYDIPLATLVVAVAAGSVALHMSRNPAVPETSVCPVCGMSVQVTPTTPSATVDGRTYYFMTDAMRERFLTEPDAFAR